MTDYSKQLRDLLREAGFEFKRPGKGSHEVWHNPKTGKSVLMPAKVPGRHFANRTLRELGSPRSSDFEGRHQ